MNWFLLHYCTNLEEMVTPDATRCIVRVHEALLMSKVLSDMILLRFVTISAVLLPAVTCKSLSDLIFPKGTTFVVDVSFSVFMPEDVAKGFAQVIELDFFYPVVEKVMGKMPPPKTVWINPIAHVQLEKWDTDWHKRNRVIKSRQKKNIRGQLENAINLFGFDGRRCVLRFLCELSNINKPETLLEDLLLVLCKERGLECTGSDNYCPFSLLQIILNSQYVNGTLH